MGEPEVPRAPLWVRVAAMVIRRLPAGRYRAIQRLCPGRGEPFRMVMLAEMGGYEFLCDLRDAISREVCCTGQYEPQETALIRRLLRPGMTFVDVGANWGYYTLVAAHLVARTGRVVSLEPHPGLYRVLEGNVRRNNLSHVVTLNVAASDRPGRLALNEYDPASGNFGVSRLDPSGGDVTRGCEVDAADLDHLLEQAGVDVIDLMKIDVEGAEGLAVAGLKRKLGSFKIRRLLLELHPAELLAHKHTPRNVLEQLAKCGYRSWSVDHSAPMTRRAAYGRVRDAHELLRPLELVTVLDNWAHLLCTGPGVEPLS